MAMQTKIINEYRLNVLDPEHTRLLRGQMKVFLGMAPPESVPAMKTPESPGT
jgi:Fe-S cluster biosynthesis and repair protein YggX